MNDSDIEISGETTGGCWWFIAIPFWTIWLAAMLKLIVVLYRWIFA